MNANYRYTFYELSYEFMSCVLCLYKQGMSHKQIARKFGLSVKIVEEIVRRLA